ncbi:MAG: bifunctional 5,10-methylenetetrahydrofolate dehydrogenase/5,10-methenyltetrahydrofolate cyclohydrolase [Patescibacteria group bacterium]
MIIDGKLIADKIVGDLKVRPRVEKFFGAVLVGEDPASVNFLRQKEKVAKELGIDFRLYTLPASITTDELRREIGRLAQPKNCGGFIVQLPLPEALNKHYVLNAIPKEKDIDVLSEAALGSFYSGRNTIVPPSVGTVKEILGMQTRDLRELKAVMVGAGFLIGKPVGFWLQNRVGELTVLDSEVKDLEARLRDADIVISGAGHPKLFSAKHLKEGATVIDFGFNKINGKIVGDFDSDGAEEKNIAYTKTPGGTGPILVAELFNNFYILNSRS